MSCQAEDPNRAGHRRAGESRTALPLLPRAGGWADGRPARPAGGRGRIRSLRLPPARLPCRATPAARGRPAPKAVGTGCVRVQASNRGTFLVRSRPGPGGCSGAGSAAPTHHSLSAREGLTGRPRH